MQCRCKINPLPKVEVWDSTVCGPRANVLATCMLDKKVPGNEKD